jgi:hypothetical protein
MFYFSGNIFAEVIAYFRQHGVDDNLSLLFAGQFIQKFRHVQIVAIPGYREQETNHRLDKVRVDALFQSHAMQKAAAGRPIVENTIAVEDAGTPDLFRRVIGIEFGLTAKPPGSAYSQPLFQFVFVYQYALDFNDIHRAAVTAAIVFAAALHAM